MKDLTVPTDEWAEQVLVGVAIDNPHAAALAADRLDPADLYLPAHRRLFTAAVEVTTPYTCDGARTREVAERAGVDLAVAERLRASRPVMDDTTGTYAARVADAAARRRAMAAMADGYALLGAGADLDAALASLRTEVVT